MTRLIVALRRAFALSRAPYAAALLMAGAMYLSASPVWAGQAFGPKAFGVYSFESLTEEQDHSPATLAGSHPYAWTMTMMFNHEVTTEKERFVENFKEEFVATEHPEVLATIYGSPKDIEVNLPVGMVVNPNATTVRCTEAQLETRPNVAGGGCPAASAVGTAVPYVNGFGKLPTPVYNMVPPPGVPAELGIDPGEVGIIAHILGRVRTGGDYGLTGEVSGIGQAVKIYGAQVTLWGDPSSASHDGERGFCAKILKPEKKIEEERYAFELKQAIEEERPLSAYPRESAYAFSCPVERTNTPLLTTPGSCTGEPLEATMSTDSWQEPKNHLFAKAFSPAITGCDALSFNPSLNVEPSPTPASSESPSGLNVDLKVPQAESLEGRAEANLKKAVVTLPAGTAVSPSSANGLGACTPEEIGLHDANAPTCPDSSKIGEAEVFTPLLAAPLKGAVYVAQQETFEGALIGLYLVAEGSGALIKLGGRVALDANTGQIVTTFDSLPQLPFSDLKLRLFGGPKAPLITPSNCGTYTTTSQLTPWSGNPPAEPSSNFTISSGCGHGFNPAFAAGTRNNHAGGFSDFSVTFSRQDGEQRLGEVRVVAPPGLLAVLKSVAQCPEPQASQGACGPDSQIGETTVAAGPGADPFWVKGGKVYLTGPYKGAPFGLSVVVPAVAGPFNLGNEIVRARIDIDSHTAQVAVTSDPLPTILKGIPLDIRTVNVTIDRKGFMFNPTNCSPLSMTGTLGSTEGTSVPVSNQFQAADCANLPFKPKFEVSTQAKTSKANGASLTVKITPSPGQANIGKARVVLPKQLPARLTTLQKACVDTVFNANPASCPAASLVGTVTAVSPDLARPLTGPAYLVSHGSAAFPDLVFVLQGEGILLYLDGNTNIKKGITTSTFNSAPDAPISKFEAVFPEGPHSVLAANIPATAKSMCAQKLAMPTAITGQNGAQMTQTTKIKVTGCPKKGKAKKTVNGHKSKKGK